MAVHGPSAVAVIATEWTFIFISALMIIARLRLRFKINHQSLQISDAFIIIAWCASVATWSFDIVFQHMGILHSNMDFLFTQFTGDPEILKTALLCSWVSNFPFFTALYMCKAAILSFYLQLFPTFMHLRRKILWAAITYTFISYVLSLLLNTFLCHPIRRNWALDGTVCVYELAMVFQVAWALHFSSDIIIFILPFCILYKLQLRRRAWLGVYFTFGLGAITIAFSLVRFLAILSAMNNPNYARSFTLIQLWSSLDANIGVIVACLPSLRPYLRKSNLSSPINPLGSYETSSPQAATMRRNRIENQKFSSEILYPTALDNDPLYDNNLEMGDPTKVPSVTLAKWSSRQANGTGSEIELVHDK